MKRHIVAIIMLAALIAAFPTGAGAAAPGGLDMPSQDAKISFRYEALQVPLEEIEGTEDTDDFQFLQDAEGTLHLIYCLYSAYESVYHRVLAPDGKWSDPQVVAKSTEYSALLSPEGELCVVWQEHDLDSYNNATDVLHTAYYKDGVFREAPAADYTIGEGPLWMSVQQLFFDNQGTLRCLYLDMFNSVYYIDGVPLADAGGAALTDVGWIIVDRQDVFHMLIVDSWDGKLAHRYSRDGGATWEGPTEVINLKFPTLIYCAIDDDGGIVFAINETGSEIPGLTLYKLVGSDYQPTVQGAYFNRAEVLDESFNPALNLVSLNLYVTKFLSLKPDADGRMRLTGTSGTANFVITVDKSGVWDLKGIYPGISTFGMGFLNNGDVLVSGLGSDRAICWAILPRP